MPVAYLARHYDPDLPLREYENREELERLEVERITGALAVVVYAGSLPRRLGGEATDAELAADKRRARRTVHALNQALRGWTKEKQPALDVNEEARRTGAQIDWAEWEQTHYTTLMERIRTISTWAIQNGEVQWGNKALVRLENEMSWVSYALR